MNKILPSYAMALMATTAWAAADLHDLPLESLLQLQVEGASRFSQPLAEAPASASIVSAEDIRHFGFRNAGEALQSLRGIYTTNERDYTYIGIRGFARPGDYNSRMLMMVDGLRVNDPIYDQAPVGHDAPIEMEWIKRLEFVPGPASALYGPNAIFGIANAVLWSGADLNGTRVSVEAGSGNMARVGMLSGRRTADGDDWIVGISTYQRRGEDLYFKEFDVPGVSNGIAQGLDGERYLKAFAKLSSGNWQIDAGLSSRRKSVPTADYGTLFNTPGNFVVDQYGHASIGHSTALANDWTQNLRLHAGTYQYSGEYVYAGLTNRDEARAAWGGLNYLLTYSGLRNHRVLIGADAQRNQHADQRNFDIDPRVAHFDDRRSGNALGLFAQDEWRIGQYWMTNLGIRLDQTAAFSAVSPRAALIFHPIPEASLKFLHGRAFRPPNNYERFYNDGNVSQKASPDLKPEHITTDELAADIALSPTLRVFGSYYHYRLDDLVEQVTDPSDGLAVFSNRTPIHAHGMEFEIESLFRNGMRLKTGLSSQRVQQGSGDPPNSPRLMGKLQLDGPFLAAGWTLGLSINAISRRTVPNGSAPGHVAGNMVMSQNAQGKLGQWSFGIYNIAGLRYPDPPAATLSQSAIPQDGRQFRLSWTIAY